MPVVSEKDPNSAELETMTTSRSPTTVMTANGEVRTKEEATVYVKELDLFVTFMLLGETPAVLSLVGFVTTGPAVKNHISSEMARELIARDQTMCHSWFLVYLRVPLRRPHLLGHHLHHRIPYLTEGDPPKIQYPKEVKVRVRSYGETCRKNRQKPEAEIK